MHPTEPLQPNDGDLQDDPTTVAAPPSSKGETPPMLHDHTPLTTFATLHREAFPTEQTPHRLALRRGG
jgi:hypothetical protein